MKVQDLLSKDFNSETIFSDFSFMYKGFELCLMYNYIPTIYGKYSYKIYYEGTGKVFYTKTFLESVL